MRPSLACAVAGLLASASHAAYVCRQPDGSTLISQTACRDRTSAPAPATPSLPCRLAPEALRDAERLDRAFLARFPDEARHRRAHADEIHAEAGALRPMNARLQTLLRERKRIDEELAFHVNRPVPPRLMAEHDANLAQLAGLTLALRERREGIARLAAAYRCRRDTHRALWNGAPPGSSGCVSPACAA